MKDAFATGRLRLTISLYLLMFAYAITITMIGPLIPVIMVQYNISLSQSGMISLFQGLGGVVAVLCGAMISDLFKKSHQILLVFFIYCISNILLIISQYFWMFLLLFFIVGASTNYLNAILNAYISDLHPGKRNFYLNLLHAFLGLGALTGPFLSSVFIVCGMDWEYIFVALAAFCTVALVLNILAQRKVPEQLQSIGCFKPVNFFKFILNKKMLVMCLIVFSYTGFVFGISTWIPTYLKQQLGTSVFVSGLPVSGLWCGVIFGRLVFSRLSDKYSAKRLLIWNNLIGGLIIIVAVVMNNPVTFIVLNVFTGFFVGIVMPLSLATACNWYPNNTGTISSVIFVFATLGQMILPWFSGIISDNISFIAGILMIAILPLCIMAFAWILPSNKKIMMENKTSNNKQQN